MEEANRFFEVIFQIQKSERKHHFSLWRQPAVPLSLSERILNW